MNAVRCLPLMFALMLSGCGLSVESGSAQNCFKDVFQQPVPAGVSSLQGSRDGYRDETVYLRFRASQPVLLKLVGPQVHFVSRGFGGLEGGGNPPAWWHPTAGNPTMFAATTSALRDPSFAQGKAYMTYDPKTQIASVYSYGWD